MILALRFNGEADETAKLRLDRMRPGKSLSMACSH